MNSINALEKKIREARDTGERVSIPRDYNTLESDLQSGNIVILHSVEGAHHLGRGIPFNEQIDHLHELARRGVCYLTLGHFFSNDFVDPVEGLPPDVREHFYHKNESKWGHASNDTTSLKHPQSAELIEEMIKIGMIIDLTHSGKEVRNQVYKINNNRKPLIISHTGVQQLFNNANHSTDKALLASNHDIEKIAECDGVIGIIFFNYWLTGIEEKNNSRIDFGLKYILQTIQHIHSITGKYTNIALGTDFDGMTDPPDDIENVSKFKILKSYLTSNGIPSQDIDAIMGGNMLRVLKNGWR